jgi:hypothetical protein
MSIAFFCLYNTAACLSPKVRRFTRFETSQTAKVYALGLFFGSI